MVSTFNFFNANVCYHFNGFKKTIHIISVVFYYKIELYQLE